jgi:hypothetical protein
MDPYLTQIFFKKFGFEFAEIFKKEYNQQSCSSCEKSFKISGASDSADSSLSLL